MDCWIIEDIVGEIKSNQANLRKIISRQWWQKTTRWIEIKPARNAAVITLCFCQIETKRPQEHGTLLSKEINRNHRVLKASLRYRWNRQQRPPLARSRKRLKRRNECWSGKNSHTIVAVPWPLLHQYGEFSLRLLVADPEHDDRKTHMAGLAPFDISAL